MVNFRQAAAAAVLLLAPCFSSSAHAGVDLDKIRARGTLICGISPGVGGFSAPDSNGKWVGFDVDLCKAVAAAIFGDGEKIQTVSLSYQARFTALQTGEVDVLTTNTTWTLQRDAGLGLTFTGYSFYDGLGFLVPKSLGATHAKELDGANVCLGQGGTAEAAVRNYFAKNKITFKPVVFESQAELNTAFFAGRCDVFVSDTSTLAAVRAAGTQTPNDYIILPELLEKSPLGPVIRKGDPQLFDVVRWTLNALITAEELGVTSKNAEELAKGDNEEIRRLLGTSPGNGKVLGLAEDWALKAIAKEGNYGELYERNFGESTPLKLPRGQNALWSEGGLIYSPPL